MAVLSDYTAGTITLTNNSTAFTGTGTAWLAADFREGDVLFQVAGQTQWTGVISTITSNTAGTLVRPWGGATGTYAYRMRYMSNVGRSTAQARNLMEQLGNGNIQAEANLSGAPNTLPYYTGPAAKALTPFTALARTLVGGATTTAMRATLEIPQLLAGFGIGQTGASVSVSDLNSITNAGVYSFASSVPNSPPETFSGTVFHTNYSAAASVQLAMSATSDGTMWMRRQTGGSWSTWRPVTPRLISNANGVAWQFAGLQICLRLTAFSVDVSTAVGTGGRGTVAWTFPAPFISGTEVNVMSLAGSQARWGGSATGVSATGCTLVHYAFSTSATMSNLFAVAIGRYE